MRSLSQAKTMKNAGLAACLTAAASFPGLVSWSNPPDKIWLLLGVNLWAAFFLWSFVFAWHERESGQRVFVFKTQPRLWLLASIGGLCAAIVLHFEVDPLARQINLEQFPKNLNDWMAGILFTLGFEQLFVCFAPFAFFIRLTHRRDVAFVLTVLLGVLVLCLKLSSIHQWSPSVLAMELLIARIVVSSLSIYFYLRGGILMTWWWILLLQARHLAGFSI